MVRGGWRVGMLVALAPAVAHADALEDADGPTRAADVLIIDGDAHVAEPPDQCPGAGTEESPFRSLDCAMASGSIRAGTTVVLRDSDTPYEGFDSSAHMLPDGMMDAPVTIRPEAGHAPILVGPIVLVGLDRWELHDLTFDGSGGGGAGEDAVRIEGGVDDVEQVRIEGLTIRSWLGRGIALQGTAGSSIVDAVVTDNRIDLALETAISVRNAHGTQITRNELSDVVCTTVLLTTCDDCGPEQCAACGDCLDVPIEMCGATTDYEWGRQIGIEVRGDSADTTIAYNYVHDLDDADCGPQGTRSAAILVAGPQVVGGTVDHNFIERVGPGDVAHGSGILMLQSASTWVVERNVLHQVGRCALCEGDDLFYGSGQAQWRHNTVVEVAGAAIDVRRAVEAQLHGNLVTEAEQGAVRVRAEGIEEPPSFDYNLYWRSSGDEWVGRWGDEAPLDLVGWQAACGSDTGSLWAAPGFPEPPPLDVTPAPDGPAVDRVPLLGEELFHGVALDAGALEPPVVLEAIIRAGASRTVAVVLENDVAPDLNGVTGCVGFSIESGGQMPAFDMCSLDGSELRLHMVEPIIGFEPVLLHYEAGAITDAADIGGRLASTLRSFTMAVINESPIPPDPEPGEDSGDTGDGDGGPTSGASGDDGVFDDILGCGCRNGGRSPVGGLGWLLVLLAHRRSSGRRTASAGQAKGERR